MTIVTPKLEAAIKRYKQGKNPNSLENLKKGPHSQNHATRVAAQVNWLNRSFKGAKGTCGAHVIWAGYKAALPTMSDERKYAYKMLFIEIEALQKQLDRCIGAANKIKDTPIRNPEAVKEARVRRKRREIDRIELS